MGYQPKIIKGRITTSAKTPDDIRKECEGQKLTDEEIELAIKSCEYFAGLVLTLSLWDYDGHSCYHLSGWNKEDDEAVMMGMYYEEQIGIFLSYKNKQERFIRDWKAGKYEPCGTYTFPLSDVEVLEVLQEERKDS